MSHLKEYGVEGPLGFPMLDRQAAQLDAILKGLPKEKEYDYRKSVTTKAPTELNPGERSDVSWVSTQSVDRANEIVLSKGINWSHFQQNPVVTLNHNYYSPSVGKSLWQKKAVDGELVGVKAKTRYPEKPAAWGENEPWPSDKVFALVQAGLLSGKSIGFIPTKVRMPDEKESQKNGWPRDVVVIEECLALEYACCTLPMNQDSITEAVSKGLIDPATVEEILGQEVPKLTRFTSAGEIEKAVQMELKSYDLTTLVEKWVQETYDRMLGRV